jgi:hypothetical protein
MKTTDSFAILFWANKSKTDLNGTMPVYARVTVLGKRAEISLKKRVRPEKWDAKSGFMKGSGEEARAFNKFLVSVDTDLRNIYYQFKQDGIQCTAEEIKYKYGHVNVIRKSLLEVFDHHNSEVAALVGKDLVKGTLTKYVTIRSKVADYLAHRYQRKDIFLDQLEYAFITGFEHYLKTEQLISHNVVMAYIKRVKRVMNMAIDNQWLSVNPFRKFVCTSKKLLAQNLKQRNWLFWKKSISRLKGWKK